MLNIWRVKNNVTDDWNGSEPVHQKEGSKDKEGKEYDPTHKSANSLVLLIYPMAKYKTELVDLKVESLSNGNLFAVRM